MKTPVSLRNGTPGGRAFTLLELLVVSAILLIILALVTPSVVGILRSSNLNRAASMTVAEFNLARQTALTRNRDVEVRIYRLGSKTAPADLQYRAIRSFYADDAVPARAEPLGELHYLPEPVIISADPKFSTLIDHASTSRSGLSYLSETFPGEGTSAHYVSFLFRPTGGTNLSPVDPPDGRWFLTVYLGNAAVNSTTGLPDNYFTAQLDPVTGRVRLFRP